MAMLADLYSPVATLPPTEEPDRMALNPLKLLLLVNPTEVSASMLCSIATILVLLQATKEPVSIGDGISHETKIA